MSKNRTDILEGARRVAYVWQALRSSARHDIARLDPTLAAELDGLLVRCTPPPSDFPETEV